MKYILNEDEFRALTPKKEANHEVEKRDMALEVAKNLILKLANFKCNNQCYSCPIGGHMRVLGYELDHFDARMICQDPNKNYPK